MFEFFKKMGGLEFDFIPGRRRRIGLLILGFKIGHHRVPELRKLNPENMVIGGSKGCPADFYLATF